MKKHLLIAFLFLLMFKTFAQPTITTFAPTSGAIGTTVIITGTNFNTTPANNIVFFGATRATVSAGSSTSLTVTVPSGASYQPISVTNITTGLTAYSSKPFIVTFPSGISTNPSSFGGEVNFTTGALSSSSVSTGDLDGDGKTDLAVANDISNTISVYRNIGISGTVSFAAKVDFTTGTNPYSISIGDFDGDGKLDLAVANASSNTISVFRNTGSSGIISFAIKVDFATGSLPISISTGDFDVNGKLDLVVANRSSNTVSVFRNTSSSGTISFAAKEDLITGTAPYSISMGDFDGDGKPDFAVANSTSNTVSVFRNTGSSGTISFAAKVDFITGTAPTSISIGDYDGDGRADLVVANTLGTVSVYVFRNTSSSGTISFAAKVEFSMGTYSSSQFNYSITSGDLDGDGKPDLAIANQSYNAVLVFRNTSSIGTISFDTKVDFTTGSAPASISIGDFDGDGKPDIAVANATSSMVSVIRNLEGICICLPKITSFTPASGAIGTTVMITGTNFSTIPSNNIVFFGATRATVSAGSATSLTVTVPSGASYEPISVTNITTGLTAYSSKPFITTFVCVGVINTSSFATKVDLTIGTTPWSISTGDFDGDGKTDLAFENYKSNTVSVLRNTSSSGTISYAAKVDFSSGTGPARVTTGDFDGDGKLDIAIKNIHSGYFSILRNTSSSGTISFAAKVDFPKELGVNESISSGDFDGDGKLDLAITNNGSNTVSIFRNTGSSGIISFAAKVDFTTGSCPDSISTGDFDGDGKTDLAVSNYCSASVSILRNLCINGIISFAAKVDFSTDSGPTNISVGDLNGDGKLDLAVSSIISGTVSVLRNMSSSGTISFAAKFDFSPKTNSAWVSISDLDGDGKLDLAVANYSPNNGDVSVLRNTSSNGNISFSTRVDFTTGSNSRIVSIGDLDGDGKLDIAVINSNNVSVLRNTVSIPIIINASATVVCRGDSVTLTGEGANTYSWTGGVTNGVAFVPPTGTTTYTVTGTNTTTGCQNTATIEITVNTILPTVIANATATTVCDGEAITLTGGGTASTYAWSGGVTDGVEFVPSTGTTIYTVTGTKDGCKNIATKTITVNPLPTVTANATATTICEGDTITLTGGGTADKYDWLDGVDNGVAFVPIMGTNIYTVIGTNTTTGCVNTATKNIFVNPIPTLEITATDITKCSGPCSGTATVLVTNGTAPFSYLWSNGQTTNAASFLCQGSTLTVTDIKGCKTENNINSKTFSNPNANIYLTNLAAIDQAKLSPAFASFYSYNLPTTINANPSNPRNFVDPGKKARFKVECTNKKANGQSIVSGVCQVRSNCPYITITDASSALNNIGWNNKAWSADEFEIDIKPNTPPGTIAYIDFIVIENGVEYPTTCIPLPITPLNYSPTTSATIDDDDNPDSKGNDNEVCEPNEIIEFYPWLDNVSALSAEFVRGRFENLDNLSYINIWNNKAGVNTTVFDSTWWNFSFAQPAIINSNSTNMTPEFDFVFDYNNPNIVNNFKLYLVMAGGFKLFSGNALSLVQWSLPYTFNDGALSTSDFFMNDNLIIYPNPVTTTIKINNSDALLGNFYSIIDISGRAVAKGILATNSIDVSKLSKGVYVIRIGKDFKSKFIKE